MNYRYILLIIISCIITTSCQHNKNKMPETAFIPQKTYTKNNPPPLTIHLAVNDTYCKKTACSCIHQVAARDYSQLQKILKIKYNINLKLTYFPEIYVMEEEVATKKFDGVICKPWFAYMNTQKLGENNKRIVDILDPNNNQWLTGIVMVPKNSPIKTLKQLNNKIISIGQYDAYEKYHSAIHFLNKHNITARKFIYKASCIENIGCLLDNESDAVVVSDYVMSASCAVDIANEDDFRILGVTEKSPLTSVILDMNKVSSQDATRLQQALLALSGKNSPKGILSNGFVKPAKWQPEPEPNYKKTEK